MFTHILTERYTHYTLFFLFIFLFLYKYGLLFSIIFFYIFNGHTIYQIDMKALYKSMRSKSSLRINYDWERRGKEIDVSIYPTHKIR